MKLSRSTAGYTLVELVIALSVISILSLVVLNFFGNALVQNAVTTARANLLGEAHITLDKINNDIRLSASADENNRWEDDNAPGGDMFGWSSDGNVLVLATAAEDQDGNIIFEDASQYISWKNNNIYFVSDGTLYKRVLAAPVDGNKAATTCPAAAASASCPKDREMLHDIESFTFRYLDGDNLEVAPVNARSVEISVALKKRTLGRDVTAAYTTRTVFRND